MQVTITCCERCGSLHQAQRLADELREELDAEVEVLPGGKDVFQVRVDGELLFDRQANETTPEPYHVLETLHRRTVGS